MTEPECTCRVKTQGFMVHEVGCPLGASSSPKSAVRAAAGEEKPRCVAMFMVPDDDLTNAPKPCEGPANSWRHRTASEPGVGPPENMSSHTYKPAPAPAREARRWTKPAPCRNFTDEHPHDTEGACMKPTSWTIRVCEDHRAQDCALCSVFDVLRVVQESTGEPPRPNACGAIGKCGSTPVYCDRPRFHDGYHSGPPGGHSWARDLSNPTLKEAVGLLRDVRTVLFDARYHRTKGLGKMLVEVDGFIYRYSRQENLIPRVDQAMPENAP